MPRWIERLLFSLSRAPAHLAAGWWGERKAAGFLKKNRYRLLGQRVRVGRRAELDIIAEKEGVLVFVEVKTRRTEAFGRPFSAVDRHKRKTLSRAAIGYLKRKKIEPKHIRFDVVEVVGEPGGNPPEIRHIQNAFPLDAAYRLWW